MTLGIDSTTNVAERRENSPSFAARFSKSHLESRKAKPRGSWLWLCQLHRDNRFQQPDLDEPMIDAQLRPVGVVRSWQRDPSGRERSVQRYGISVSAARVERSWTGERQGLVNSRYWQTFNYRLRLRQPKLLDNSSLPEREPRQRLLSVLAIVAPPTATSSVRFATYHVDWSVFFSFFFFFFLFCFFPFVRAVVLVIVYEENRSKTGRRGFQDASPRDRSFSTVSVRPAYFLVLSGEVQLQMELIDNVSHCRMFLFYKGLATFFTYGLYTYTRCYEGGKRSSCVELPRFFEICSRPRRECVYLLRERKKRKEKGERRKREREKKRGDLL